VKLPPSRLLLLLGLLYLALAHLRHQMILAVIAPLLLAEPLGRDFKPLARAAQPIVPLCFVALLGLMIAVRTVWPVVRSDAPSTPASALSHVPAAAGPVLNDYAFGGYLIFSGVRPFIDSRADLYGDAWLSRYAAIISPDRAALEETLRAFKIGWTIFNPASPAVPLLDSMPGWRRLYADGIAVIHIRDQPR